MKEEIKKKWIEALRSGEYEKGTKVLRSINDKFCCLGILCDLYNKETGEGEWEYAHFGSYAFNAHESTSCSLLPEPVREWAGLRSYNPMTIKGSLSHINDAEFGGKYNFNDIAVIIEEDL